jgi:hypothetical protein
MPKQTPSTRPNRAVTAVDRNGLRNLGQTGGLGSGFDSSERRGTTPV